MPRDTEKVVVTLVVIRPFFVLRGAPRACENFGEPTAVSRLKVCVQIVIVVYTLLAEAKFRVQVSRRRDPVYNVTRKAREVTMRYVAKVVLMVDVISILLVGKFFAYSAALSPLRFTDHGLRITTFPPLRLNHDIE